MGSIGSIGSAIDASTRMERVPRASLRTDSSAAPPSSNQQVSELVEGFAENAEAEIEIQALLIRQGLDLAQEMAMNMLSMVDGARAYRSQASMAEPSSAALDVVA